MLRNLEVHVHFAHKHWYAINLIQKWESLKYSSENTWQWQLCHRNAQECHAELHGKFTMDNWTLLYQVAVTARTGSQSGSVSITDVHCSTRFKFTHTDTSVATTERRMSEARCWAVQKLAKHTRIYISKMSQILWQAFKRCKTAAKCAPHHRNEVQQRMHHKTNIYQEKFFCQADSMLNGTIASNEMWAWA